MKRAIKGGDPLFCFRRWSRKPWGAFASLRRLKICVLSVGMGMVALGPKSASAQSDTLRTARQIEMEALSVTAEKLNPTRGVVTPVAVYGRDTIGAMPLQTIESALRLNPAIDLRERGGKGVQADISLRGGTADQTMVLLNGIDFTDARTGHQSHSLPIDLESVSSIDIIGGLSGIGAYSGALNFSTTPLRPRYLRAEVSGGEYGYMYGNISGATTGNGLSLMAAGSFRQSDGYRPNTDFANVNLFTRINYYSRGTGLFDIQAGYQDRAWGANGFYSTDHPNQFEHTRTVLGSVRWARDIGPNTINARASYRRNRDRFDLYRNGVGAPSPNWRPNYHLTDNAGAEVSADHNWRRAGKSSIGIDYTHNHIYSNVMGEDRSHPIPIPGTDVSYTKSKGRDILNAWLRHFVQLRNTALSGSVNVAHSSYGFFPSWSVSAAQKIGRYWSVDLYSTRSMRLPTFTDLYYSTSETHTADPTLKPEHALTNQIGASYRSGKISGRAMVYYRHGRDVIDWIKKNEQGAKWQSHPIDRLNTFGAEASLNYTGSGFIRSLSASYGYTGTMTPERLEGYTSKYAMDYMRNKVALEGSFHLWRGFVVDLCGVWYDRNNDSSLDIAHYRPYWLLDARGSWRKGVFTAYVDVTNILNAKYIDFVGLPQPPRWLVLGMIITI